MQHPGGTVNRAFFELLRASEGARPVIERVVTGTGDDVRYGILRAGAERWPVVDGIVIARRGERTDRILRALDAGRPFAALTAAMDYRFIGAFLLTLSPDAPWPHRAAGRLVAWATGHRDRASVTLFPLLDLIGRLGLQRFWTTYLKHRFSATSFRCAMPLIQDAHPRNGWMIDIGCGIGTSSFVFAKRMPASRIVCQNLEFTGLYLARRFVVPGAHYLCSDFGEPQPFDDGAFELVFSSDALQYVGDKQAACREVGRLVASDGRALLVHNHTPGHKDFSGQQGRGDFLVPSDALRTFGTMGLAAAAIGEDEVFRSMHPTQELL